MPGGSKLFELIQSLSKSEKRYFRMRSSFQIKGEKNQYMRLFEFENVKLKFTDDALHAIAHEALNRKVGARGLRMILEELMLDLMYHLPSQKKVKEFEVTREMVEKRDVSLAMLEKAG